MFEIACWAGADDFVWGGGGCLLFVGIVLFGLLMLLLLPLVDDFWASFDATKTFDFAVAALMVAFALIVGVVAAAAVATFAATAVVQILPIPTR